MRNRGGLDCLRSVVSPTYQYVALSGSPAQCAIHGWPEKIQLGVALSSLCVEVKDSAGNLVTTSEVPPVNFSSETLTFAHEAGGWKEAAGGAHGLPLSSVAIKPTHAFRLEQVGKAVRCQVKMHVGIGKGPELVNEFGIDVYPGMTVHRCLRWCIAWQNVACCICAACWSLLGVQVPDCALLLLLFTCLKLITGCVTSLHRELSNMLLWSISFTSETDHHQLFADMQASPNAWSRSLQSRDCFASVQTTASPVTQWRIMLTAHASNSCYWTPACLTPFQYQMLTGPKTPCFTCVCSR